MSFIQGCKNAALNAGSLTEAFTVPGSPSPAFQQNSYGNIRPAQPAPSRSRHGSATQHLARSKSDLLHARCPMPHHTRYLSWPGKVRRNGSQAFAFKAENRKQVLTERLRAWPGRHSRPKPELPVFSPVAMKPRATAAFAQTGGKLPSDGRRHQPNFRSRMLSVRIMGRTDN